MPVGPMFAWHPYVVASHCICSGCSPYNMTYITLHSYADLYCVAIQVEGEKTATGADKETFGTGVIQIFICLEAAALLGPKSCVWGRHMHSTHVVFHMACFCHVNFHT